jgi:hypothetical protein
VENREALALSAKAPLGCRTKVLPQLPTVLQERLRRVCAKLHSFKLPVSALVKHFRAL